MKNEKMDKMMRKARVNLRLAKLKAMDLAKETGKRVDAAWNAANKAMDEYRKDMAVKKMKKEQEEIEEKKCNCGCCHCKDEMEKAVEPVFDMNEFKEEMNYEVNSAEELAEEANEEDKDNN